jgi:hypothetical protein
MLEKKRRDALFITLSPWTCNAVVTAKLPYLPVLVKLLVTKYLGRVL